MSYKVVLSERAQQQFDQAYQWYAERSPQRSVAWYNGFIDALESLGENPRRHGLAAENPHFSVEVRQLLYGRHKNYRAIFTIRKDYVFVFSIRHAAQRDVAPDDL